MFIYISCLKTNQNKKILEIINKTITTWMQFNSIKSQEKILILLILLKKKSKN